MNHRLDSRGAAEEAFARRLCGHLDQGVGMIEPSHLQKLASARKLALRTQRSGQPRVAAVARPVLGLAGRGFAYATGSAGPGRYGIAFGIIGVVFACLLGIFQIEQQRRIEELADIDSQLLSSDEPIAAYADHGFNAYLKQNP